MTAASTVSTGVWNLDAGQSTASFTAHQLWMDVPGVVPFRAGRAEIGPVASFSVRPPSSTWPRSTPETRVANATWPSAVCSTSYAPHTQRRGRAGYPHTRRLDRVGHRRRTGSDRQIEVQVTVGDRYTTADCTSRSAACSTASPSACGSRGSPSAAGCTSR